MAGLTDATLDHFAELDGRIRKVIDGLDLAALTQAPAAGENSIAILITHTLGSELGWLHRAAGIEFKRDRDAEFRARSGADQLARALDATAPRVRELVHAAARRGYDTKVVLDGGREITVGYCVMHALSHATEHVGHAELTRTLLGFRPK